MKKLSKILVALLTLAMLLGVIVISATATEAETGTVIEAPTQAALDAAVAAANDAGEEAGTVTIRITGDYSIKTRIKITRTTGKVVLDLNGHQLATSGFTGGDSTLLSLDLDTSGNPITTDSAAQFRVPVIYLGAGADLEVYGNGGTFVSTTGIQNTLFAIPADAVGAKLHVADMVISKHLSNGGSLSSNSYRKNAFAVVFNGEFSMDNVKLDTAMTYGYVFRQAGNAEITVKNSTITQYMVAGSGLLHTGSTSTSAYTPENGYHIEFENCTIVTSELIHSAQRDKYAYGDNLTSNSITAYSSVDTRDVTKTAGYYTNVKALFKNCNVENLNYSNENAIAYFMQGGYADVDFKKSNVLIAHKGFYFSKNNGDVNNPCVVNFYDSYLELTGKGKIYYTHASNSESSPNCQVAVKLESGTIHYYATEIRMGSLFQRDASGNVLQPNGSTFAYTSFGFGALHDGCIVDSFLGSNQYWGPGKPTRYSGLTRIVLDNGDCYYTTAADASAVAYRSSGATATVSWTATTSASFGSSTSSTYYLDSTAAGASSTSTVTYYGTDRALANGYGATVTLLQNAVKVELSVPTTINKNGKELFYYSENCTTSTDGDIVTVALAPADAAKYTVTVDYDDGEAPETVTYVEGSYFWYNLDRLPAELGGFDSETGKVTSLTLNGVVVESLGGFEAPVLLAGSKTEIFALEATKEYGWVILTPEGNFVDGFENYATSDDIGETWAELVARVNEIEKYLNPMDESDTTPDIVDGKVAEKFFVGGVHTKKGYTIKLYKDFLNTESDPVSTLNFRNNVAFQLTNDGRGARNRPIVIDLNGHTVVTPEMLFYSYSDLIVWYYDADGFVVGVKGIDYSKEIVGANQTQNFTAGTIEGDGITGAQVYYGDGARAYVTVASKVGGARIIATSETEPVAQANATGNSVAYANIGAAGSAGYARLRIDAPMLIKTTVYNCYTNVVNVEAHLSGATPIRSDSGWAVVDNAQLFYEGYQTEGFIRVGGRQIYLRNATIISDSKVNLFATSVVESNSQAKAAYIQTSNIFNLYIDSDAGVPHASGKNTYITADTNYNLPYNQASAEAKGIVLANAQATTSAYVPNVYANTSVTIGAETYVFAYKVVADAASIVDVTWNAGSSVKTDKYLVGTAILNLPKSTYSENDAISKKEYGFSSEIIGTVVNEAMEFTAAETGKIVLAFMPQHNLELYTNLYHNIIFPRVYNGVEILDYVTEIKIGETVVYSGEMTDSFKLNDRGTDDTSDDFYFSTIVVKSNEIADSYVLSIKFNTEAGVSHTVSTSTSVLDYVEYGLGAESRGSDLYNLYVSLINYGKAAYVEFGGSDAGEARLDALLDTGIYNLPVAELPEGNAEASGEFEIEFVLDATLAYRIYLPNDFTHLEVRYNDIFNTPEVRRYTNVKTDAEGRNYIDFIIPAYELSETVITIALSDGDDGEIEEDSESGELAFTYNIKDYYAAIKDGSNSDLIYLVESLYSYSYYANRYVASLLP